MSRHRWFLRDYGALCKDCLTQRRENQEGKRTHYYLNDVRVSDGIEPLCSGAPPVRKVVKRTPV